MRTSRRDAGRPRGVPIEQAILTATLDDLAEFGVEGLSIPRVADRASVNKTTIYRRWPTREQLVAAALHAALEQTSADLCDTGSLRGDLLLLIRLVTARLDSPTGRALAHAAMSDQASASVAELSQDPSVRGQPSVLELVARAARRGEWDPALYSPDVVLSMITGSVMHRVLLEHLPVTPAWAEGVVEVLLRGVAPRG